MRMRNHGKKDVRNKLKKERTGIQSAIATDGVGIDDGSY